MMVHEGEPDAPQNPVVQSPRKQAWTCSTKCRSNVSPRSGYPNKRKAAGIDREWGEELYVIVVKPEQLRRLDEWLSHLTVWQLRLVTLSFALVIVGIAVLLNSMLPPVDPNLLFPARPFAPFP